MRKILFFLLLLMSTDLAFAGLDCEVKLFRDINYRRAIKSYEILKRFEDATKGTVTECFSFGHLVLDTALELYCEAGEDSVPCQEARAGLWVSIHADKDGWFNVKTANVVLDVCGVDVFEAFKASDPGKRFPTNLRRCDYDPDYYGALHVAMGEELDESGALIARSK